MQVKRALISVSDRRGVGAFARALTKEFHIEVIATSGTAAALQRENVSAVEISHFTGANDTLNGLVKTLHQDVYMGILCRRDQHPDSELIAAKIVRPIDLVVVNLYPFRETVAKPNVTLQEAIENIDIGGPTMIRAAAKNYAWVAVVIDPQDYTAVLDDMAAHDGSVSEALRKRLAVKAFRHTALYDAAIDTYLSGQLAGEVVRHTFCIE